MEKFTQLTGVAAPLDMINVDTDMVIPKQFLKTIGRTGLGPSLFFEMRYLDDGSENPDFVLNKPQYRDAKILIAGDNFGCGSSREHAPWALLDFGITCVIAPSLADIFYNNCFKNGILPITLPRQDVEKLLDDAERLLGGTLSAFMARHMEHPGSRHSKPASIRISARPSSSAWSLIRPEPGTTSAVTPSATLRPLVILAAARMSSMRPLVHAPTKK